MLYLYCALIINVAVFSIGLTVSIIDINRYNFGLYLVLITVVASSLLAAVWVAKPKACTGTPGWLSTLSSVFVRRDRIADVEKATEVERLMERYHAEQLLSNIRGIPHLIQAVQCSLEVSLAQSAGLHHQYCGDNDCCPESRPHDHHCSNRPGFSLSGSEGEEDHNLIMCRQNDGCTYHCQMWHGLQTAVQHRPSTKPSLAIRVSKSDDELHLDEMKNSNKNYCECCERSNAERRHLAAQLAIKRQSVFVFFPYSETTPVVSSISKPKTTSTIADDLRRSSSAECLKKSNRKSEENENSTSLKNDDLLRNSKMVNKNVCSTTMSHSCSGGSFDNKVNRLKKEISEYRRPSFEVRLISIHHPAARRIK